MKILHIVQSLGVGGQEKLVLNLSRSLQRLGHQIIVVSFTEGGELAPEFNGIELGVVQRRVGLDTTLPWRLSRFISALRPDVVHTHNPSPLIYGAPAAKMVGVGRIVHTKHGVNPYGDGATVAQRLTFGMLSAYVAVSGPTAEVARKREGVPAAILHVVENGIPLDCFHPDPDTRVQVREEFGIPQHSLVIGSVGRLAEEKNYPMLVRSLAPILSERVRFILVGDGPERDAIRGCVSPDLAPWVTLTGSRRDVPRLLAAMDVFALTSDSEGLPLAVPEAMACGLPVVATRVGSLPEIVPAETGWLVDARDDRGLAELWRAIAADRAEHRKRGLAARQYALSRFSLARTTDAYLALYEDAREAAA